MNKDDEEIIGMISDLKKKLERMDEKSDEKPDEPPDEETLLRSIKEFKENFEKKYGVGLELVKIELGEKLISKVFRMLPELEANLIVLCKTASGKDQIFADFATSLIHVLCLFKKVIIVARESKSGEPFAILNSALKLIANKYDLDLEDQVEKTISSVPAIFG